MHKHAWILEYDYNVNNKLIGEKRQPTEWVRWPFTPHSESRIQLSVSFYTSYSSGIGIQQYVYSSVPTATWLVS